MPFSMSFYLFTLMHVLPLLLSMSYMLAMHVPICSYMSSVCLHAYRWGLELSSPLAQVGLHAVVVGRQRLQRPTLDAAVSSV